jgi:hypothetical protein
LRSAIRPASVAIAISAGTDIESDRPVHAADLVRRHAQFGQGRDVRSRVPGVAQDAHPARVAGQCVAEHRAQLGPVVIGDDHVSRPVRVAGDAVMHLSSGVQQGLGPLGVGLDQHRPVASIAGVAQQEAGHGRGEDGHQ